MLALRDVAWPCATQVTGEGGVNEGNTSLSESKWNTYLGKPVIRKTVGIDWLSFWKPEIALPTQPTRRLPLASYLFCFSSCSLSSIPLPLFLLFSSILCPLPNCRQLLPLIIDPGARLPACSSRMPAVPISESCALVSAASL